MVGGTGTPANTGMYASAPLAAAAQRAAPGGNHGRSSSSRPPPPRPKLLLDSGAGIHVVGDPRLLSNLRAAPAGMRVTVADGNTSPVTKVGDIHIQGFTIPDVHLAPGIQMGVISVRVLTRSRICTFFDGDRALLFAGADLVGEAVAPKCEDDLYVLQSLSVPNSGLDDGEIRLLPVWSFGSVICWLKALLRERLLGPEPEEKPTREPHVSNRTRREPRRKKGKKSGTRR